jgi:hypothetical protein
MYNDLLAGDEAISITANEIPSTYAVLLGRKPIKQNKISLKCFRFFSNLEIGESLRGFVSYNLYATSPKPQLCSASFSAPAAVAKPQAIVDFRGGEETKPANGWPKERFLTPEPDEDFVDPADEYKMPWEEDMPLLEEVSSKAGNASSYAASIERVRGVRYGRVRSRVGIPGYLLNGVESGTRGSTSLRCTY